MAEVSDNAPQADGSRAASAEDAPARSAVSEAWLSLRSVFANPNLRRVQLALGGSEIGDGAYATAVAVWAYGVGGAQAVGVWMAVRLTLLALVSPVGAALADRYPRKAVMVVTDLVRAMLVIGAAGCVYLDLHPGTVFVLATLVSLCGTSFRPAQRALMPSLVERPDELTASNGTASTIESLSFFIGPALGAALLAVVDVPALFLLNAGTFVWSMLLVLGVSPRTEPAAAAQAPVAAPATDEGTDDASGPGFLGETLAGFGLIWRDRDLLAVTAQVAAQTIIAGASAVIFLVFAVDLLDTGPRGVGFLESVFGVGAVLGGFLAIARASRGRLAGDMTIGVVLWSVPLLLVTAWPSPVTAFAAVAILGLGNPLVDVNMDTIVQRITPDAVMGRVFGAIETCVIATMALGAAVTPFLMHWLGLRGALAVLGVLVGALALAALPRMRSLDRRLARPAGLDLLERIAMFAPLAPSVLDALARRLGTVSVPAGDVVLREGEASDRFYVIAAGEVEVTQQGRVLRREASGDFFGEIGLLRDVPRTATITAVSDTELLALDRDDFLSAVAGAGAARSAAEDVVQRRLAV